MATGYKAQIIKGTTKVTYIILRAFGSISIKNYELKLVLEDQTNMLINLLIICCRVVKVLFGSYR